MSPPRTLLLALALLAAGCAGAGHAARGKPLPPPAQDRPANRNPYAAPAPGSASARRSVQARAVPHDQAVHRAVEAADSLVGSREVVLDGVRYGDGCAAVARAALSKGGAPLPAGADRPASILELARARGAFRRAHPAAGDLVFLADRPGGPAEHVGVVESVSPEGTALVVHRTERGVARLHLNPAHAWKTRAESGRALNDLVVVGGGKVTAGRLVVGFATLL